MKKLSLLVLLMGLASCRNNAPREVVKETFIHKYGVPINPTDWKEQGEDGNVVQLCKNGVTITRSYEKGVLDGECTFTFPNSSTIEHIETYQNGELISKRKNFPSGIPMIEEQFENQELRKLTYWHEDGTPSSIETYQQGLIVSGEYRTSMNTIESRVQNGEGSRIRRNSEGDFVSKDIIQNGRMVERISYFSNGDPAAITHYENNVIHGTRMTFLQGGLPSTVEEWVNGEKDGITVLYQNGEKIAEVPYIHNNKHGVERRFRDGVELVEEVTWKHDTQHGPRKIYVDGVPKTEWYHQGEVVSRTTFERMNPPRSI